MNKTLSELEEEFQELEKVVEEMRKNIKAAKEKPVWTPPTGGFLIFADGEAGEHNTRLSHICQAQTEFGMRRPTLEWAKKSASRMRFFNRLLARIEQTGWDSTIVLDENPAGDITIVFYNSLSTSEILKETKNGELDL